MSSADRGSSPTRDAASDDSESGRTAEDSAIDDDVYSDLEYSRVIPSPATQRRASTRSTPKTPKSAARARNQHNDTPTAMRQATRGSAPGQNDKNGLVASGGESQTQKVLPITATQLQRLGLGLPGLSEAAESPEPDQSQDDRSRFEENVGSPHSEGPGQAPQAPHDPSFDAKSELHAKRDNIRIGFEVEPGHEGGVDADLRAGVEADTTGFESDELPDVILSDDERVSSGSEELGTPRVAQPASGSYGSGGLVEETPMRYQPLNASQYVYVLCMWQRKWYPARALRVDYEEAKSGTRSEPALVLFGDGTTDRTDLSQTLDFDLQVGDRVQVELAGYKNKKFEVMHLLSDDSVVGPVRTMSGHTRVRLRTLHGATKGAASQSTTIVDVGELSLTRTDIELWKSMRSAEQPRSDASASSPTNQRLARLVRGKRKRHDGPGTALPDPPSSRRRRIASSRDVSLTMRQKSEEARKLASTTHAALTEPPKTQIFSKCVFSISMSDQADDESEQIKQLIRSHGGTVLNNGLSDLVTLTETTESGDMPTHDLKFGDAEFAAVLAEKPRRTIKYLEMLAVGWPCLMSGYIKECIHQGAFLDWVPWTLPAGVSSVARKAGALVNANISQFYRGWLRGEKLVNQFSKRRIILKCTIPICVALGVRKRERSQEVADAQRLFLASLCAPHYKLWVYRDHEEVPDGSLLLQLGENKGHHALDTVPDVLHQMKNLATADALVIKDASWLLECIINGELI